MYGKKPDPLLKGVCAIYAGLRLAWNPGSV